MGWGCMSVFAIHLSGGVWQVGRWMMGVALARVSPGGVDGAPRPTTLRVGDKYVRVAEVSLCARARSACFTMERHACVCCAVCVCLQGHGGVLSYVDRAKSKGGTELLFRNV